MSRRYDIVIFGASGFTGQVAVERLSLAATEDGFKWAVAGRNREKLQKALDDSAVQGVDVIVCDANDPLSLRNMAEKTRLVLNCVGPYRFSGEAVVRACVEASTHHLDISGEPQFLETMQLLFHDEALAKGAYVIGSCGFDSIPADLGASVVHKAMEGPVNSIDTYLRITSEGSGARINYGTWKSVIHGLANGHELPALRRKLYPERLPKLLPRSGRKGALHKSSEFGWCVPFLGSDRSVMLRSERSRFRRDGARPAQVQCHLRLHSFFAALLFFSVGMLYFLLTRFRFGCRLMENHPGLLSLGMVSRNGPSKETRAKTGFEMTLVGMGWAGRKEEGSLPVDAPIDRRVEVTVRAKDMGYTATCDCLVQAAAVLLKEANKVPLEGGVLTPGYAFADTSLVERLRRRGVTFDVEVKSV